MPELELTIPSDANFSYDPEKEIITISMMTGYTQRSVYSVDSRIEVGALKTHRIPKARETEKVTCTNGFGAKFNYLHTFSANDEFGIGYLESDLYREPNSYKRFEFKMPMSITEVRRNITANEKNLNGNLKFVVKLKPTFPFYTEGLGYLGNSCGDKNTINGGNTYTFRTEEQYALFSITNLKIIDLTNNKILLERRYSDYKSASETSPPSTNVLRSQQPTTSSFQQPLVPNPKIRLDR